MDKGVAEGKRRDREDLREVLRYPEEDRGRQAASRLLSRYRERTYLWCFKYLGDHERAQETAQEVLLKAYRALHRLEEDARFDGWLFIVARNTCFKQLRRPSLLMDHQADPDSLRNPARLPDQIMEEKQDEEALLALMGRCLEPLEQRALALRCFECLPVESITRMLDLGMATGARALLQRARRKLRSALAERRKAGDRS